MFRILLIDDEPHHIDHLTKLISKSKQPFTICGTASDGQSGLELYHELHPDLIISDIKMPMKNGLTMTEEIKKENKETPVILISAYQEFEYARKGLHLGILDYLLKPVDEEQMIRILQKAEKSLIISRSNMLRRHLFPLQRDPGLPSSDIQSTLKTLKPYQLVMYLPQPGGENLENLWIQSGRKKPNEILELETQLDGSRLFLFSSSDSVRTVSIKEKGIQKGHIVLSEINPGYDCWESLCNNMNEILWDNTIWGGSGITGLNQAAIQGESQSPFSKYEWELKSALASDLNENFAPLLKKLLWEMYNDKILIGQLKEGIRQLDNILIKEFAIKKNIPESQIRRILDKLNQDLIKLNFGPEEIASSLIHTLEASIPEELSRSYSIQKVKEFMDRNYTQNIDTTSLADMTGVSAKTLNHLFLKEFGMSPSKYLIEIRIEIAKKLLRSRPDLQIKEIANETGYEDPLYFSRIFHRKVGMNPTQYRVDNQS